MYVTPRGLATNETQHSHAQPMLPNANTAHEENSAYQITYKTGQRTLETILGNIL
jgi:hypothetical protein